MAVLGGQAVEELPGTTLPHQLARFEEAGWWGSGTVSIRFLLTSPVRLHDLPDFRRSLSASGKLGFGKCLTKRPIARCCVLPLRKLVFPALEYPPAEHSYGP